MSTIIFMMLATSTLENNELAMLLRHSMKSTASHWNVIVVKKMLKHSAVKLFAGSCTSQHPKLQKVWHRARDGLRQCRAWCRRLSGFRSCMISRKIEENGWLQISHKRIAILVSTEYSSCNCSSTGWSLCARNRSENHWASGITRPAQTLPACCLHISIAFYCHGNSLEV